MITEKELILKIKELRQVKPREEWVFSVKKELFRAEQPEEQKSGFWLFWEFLAELQRGEKFIFQHKLVFAGLTVLLVLFGVFGFAQKSVPGEALFSIRKMTEQSQTVFVSAQGQTKHNLELAGKRLDDLTKIAQENNVKKLAPAINEYQESISKAAETLARAGEIGKEIVAEIRAIKEKEDLVKSLGVEIGESEGIINKTLAEIVKREIEDWESRVLTEKQQEILVGVKEDYEQGHYDSALEKLLLLQ